MTEDDRYDEAAYALCLLLKKEAQAPWPNFVRDERQAILDEFDEDDHQGLLGMAQDLATEREGERHYAEVYE